MMEEGIHHGSRNYADIGQDYRHTPDPWEDPMEFWKEFFKGVRICVIAFSCFVQVWWNAKEKGGGA